MSASVLVTGGAGYIGSHTVRLLHQQGYKIVVLDNLVYGHPEAILSDEILLVKGNVGDKNLLRTLFDTHKFEAVLHFAAYAYVGESVTNPSKYYHNNLIEPLALLEVMVEKKCLRFIFSSTCATYGNPVYTPIDENHPQLPINPYGSSKMMLEWVARDFKIAHNLNYVFLRYFNASGASHDAQIGEDHQPETHLIPLVFEAAMGIRPNITVFGTDYDTPDGTCIRDYIHVEDLATAHLRSLERLLQGGDSLICNLGTGNGFSVKEVIQAVEKVSGLQVPVVYGERRAGDPPALVANASRAKQELNWEASYRTVESIVASAWKWHNSAWKGRYANKK
ncbi:MAG: UDP-glucose 4-epimerase GalE [Cytophagaceae bacterium]|jgi:UDP-glucose 4-epimerase|nr:UDP-glucose 4-epimerase GalE [Cytophagaceae bacterium]